MNWIEIYTSRQNRSVIEAEVVGVEEISNGEEKIPCLVVGREIKGIIPLQETGIEPGSDRRTTKGRLARLIGQKIQCIVIGIDRDNNLFTASRKQALERISARTWTEIEEGQVRKAVVRRYIRGFNPRPVNIGIELEMDGITAFLPVQEISHGWVDDLEILPLGEEIEVKIISVDKEKQKVIASLKALLPDPWPECALKYVKNGTYAGTVTGIAEYGVFVSFEPGVNCLCRHPKAGKLQKGDKVAVTITRIDAKERKIYGYIARIIRKSVFNVV